MTPEERKRLEAHAARELTAWLNRQCWDDADSAQHWANQLQAMADEIDRRVAAAVYAELGLNSSL